MTCSCEHHCSIQEGLPKFVIKLLKDMPSHLHFDMDAWSSPNHHAFVAWTVQFEFQGDILNFLLDIVEVPKVYILFVLWIWANGFQVSHRCYPHKIISGHAVAKWAHDRILACNNNNAASNNTQAVMLAKLPNMFEEINHVRCFNHTPQLSAKTLLKPFNIALADAEMITLRTMFQILKKSTMKRVQRMVARMMMMVMTIEMMT